MLLLLRKTNELFGSVCSAAEIVRLLVGERYFSPFADEKTAILLLKMVDFFPLYWMKKYWAVLHTVSQCSLKERILVVAVHFLYGLLCWVVHVAATQPQVCRKQERHEIGHCPCSGQ